MLINEQNQHWDLFCNVVDNYGDIGVSWRLARQLSQEYKLDINLWVDDLNSFTHILPTLDSNLIKQHHSGVTIIQWNHPLDIDYIAGRVIIEAFGCQLPPVVIEKIDTLQQMQPHLAPLWLNLEYLSAEAWVDEYHALPSLQANGLNKFFYFPGFTQKTGGLICENKLLSQRDNWQSNSGNRDKLFTKLGVTGIGQQDKVVSIFSYQSTALTALCEYWQTSEQKVHALIPLGQDLTSFNQYFEGKTNNLVAGDSVKKGNLTLHLLPMTDQTNFDHLLWSCDFNIVRGEDSFLRAQWAAKPFIWHIYPQTDDYHLVKLRAFMQRYCHQMPASIASTWQGLNLAFNQTEQNATVKYWRQLETFQSAMLQHAKKWPMAALKDTDLAKRLIQFVKIKNDEIQHLDSALSKQETVK